MSLRYFGFSLLLAGVFSWGWTLIEPWLFPASEARTQVELGAVQPATIIQPQAQVLITGAVKTPGIYRVPKGLLVYDLIQRAGGLTPDADVAPGLLAKALPDGGEVHIPRAIPHVGEQNRASEPSSAGAGSSDDKTVSSRHKNKKNKKKGPLTPITLNTATVAQLDTLPGVGPKLAARIVAYRQEHGPFARIEDLRKVSGMGGKRFEDIKGYLR
jgi:competence protein ComEA